MKYEFPIHLIDSKDKLARTTFIPEFSKLNSKLFVTPFVFSFEGENVMLSLDKNGWWNPQGGHQEGNETINETVIREANEEAGVIISDIKFVGAIEFDTLEFRSLKSRNYPKLSYLPTGYSKIISIISNWIPMETKDCKLVNYNEALDLLQLRDDNNLMYEIFKFIFEEYKRNYGKN